jgi:transcriptional regulator with XRE-family HTH domain
MVKIKATPSHPSLGTSLRKRRKDLALSMQSVADAAGLSVGFISQVERGLTMPSLSSLVGIAEALQAPLSEFLSQPTAHDTTRQNDRVHYAVDPNGPSYERLSSSFTGSQLYSVIIHEPPGHRAEPICHRGEEMFFVLNGEITVEIEGKVEILKAGDSKHFDSARVHSTWNHTAEPASILWAGTMDIFGDAPTPIHNSTSVNGDNL